MPVTIIWWLQTLEIGTFIIYHSTIVLNHKNNRHYLFRDEQSLIYSMDLHNFVLNSP